MLTHSNNQGHPLRKIIKALLILMAILLMAGLAQHLWGRWKLASVKRDMTRRGQVADLSKLPTASSTNYSAFTNGLAAIQATLGHSVLSGGGNLVNVGLGLAARGSQAPVPIAYDVQVKATNGHAFLKNNTTNTWENFQQHYERRAPALAELRSLMSAPPRAVNVDVIQAVRSNTVPNFIPVRGAAQTLNDAIVINLHQGNLMAAEENLLALAGFMHLYADDPYLVSQMIRVAVEGIGAAALWDAMQAEGWSDEQLKRIQQSWNCAPVIPGVVRTLHVERLAKLDTYDQMRQHSYKEWAAPYQQAWQRFGGVQPFPGSLEAMRDLFFHPVWRVLWAHEEMAEYLKRSEHLTTLPENLLADRNFINFRTKWSEAENLTEFVPAPQRFYLEIPYYETWAGLPFTTPPLSRWLIGNLTRRSFKITDYSAVKVAAENEVRREIAVTAIALKRYALKNHRFPPDLNTLVPEFLDELPVDWMAGQPLRYHQETEHTYALYSVGLDGSDDGCDPIRDIVWLTPVPWQH